MKKVLLLGDPMRVSYQERVKELLSDIAEVVFPRHNSGYSAVTLWYIREQFEVIYKWGNVDLVHWNNGHWDLHRTLDDGEPLITAEEYLSINIRLYKQLAFYAKQQIFATTTPAGEGYKYDPDGIYGVPRDVWNREVAEYNAVLAPYLKHHGVAINDLHALVSAHPEYLGEDGIALSEAGVEAVAQQVAAEIRAALSRADEEGTDPAEVSAATAEDHTPIDWEYLGKK